MIVIVMGVVGAGKTTVGECWLSSQGWEFADADDFHPASNVEKIRNGIPLDDDDREPWLEHLRAAIAQWIAAGESVVLACSALKQSYRAKLTVGPEVRFVYLRGSESVDLPSACARGMDTSPGERYLASQMADLEEPEGAIAVPIDASPLQIVEQIRMQLVVGVESSHRRAGRDPSGHIILPWTPPLTASNPQSFPGSCGG